MALKGGERRKKHLSSSPGVGSWHIFARDRWWRGAYIKGDLIWPLVKCSQLGSWWINCTQGWGEGYCTSRRSTADALIGNNSLPAPVLPVLPVMIHLTPLHRLGRGEAGVRFIVRVQAQAGECTLGWRDQVVNQVEMRWFRDYIGLEETHKGHLLQHSCSKQRHLQLQQAAHGHIKSNLLLDHHLPALQVHQVKERRGDADTSKENKKISHLVYCTTERVGENLESLFICFGKELWACQSGFSKVPENCTLQQQNGKAEWQPCRSLLWSTAERPLLTLLIYGLLRWF